MVKSILGKKLGMTQIFSPDGEVIPVTVIQAGPCVVSQVKEIKTDGYSAVQLGFDDKKERLCTKPELGHFKKYNLTAKRFIREIEWDGKETIKGGDQVKVDIFEKVNKVDVTGITKGRGFAGGIKRWGFHRELATHGQSDRERAPGSLGRQHSISQGVYPGKRMCGHYGVERVTIKNLQIAKIIKNKNIMLVKGAVPGADGGYLIIKESANQKVPVRQTPKKEASAAKPKAKK